jgi:phage gp36-like protein
MAYITYQDLISRKDRNDVADLVSDSAVAPEQIDLAQNVPQELQACMDDASGLFDSYLMRGNRYTPADIAALAGTALALQKRIVCEICMWLLMQRRPDRNPERMKAQQELAESWLDKLATGENVFNLPDQIEAGLEAVVGPTYVDISNLNLNVQHCRGHYYPRLRLPSSVTRTPPG